MEPTPSPAGWHPDPSGRYEFRYYNGERWTADVSVHGQRFVDPVDGAATPTAGSFGPAAGWRPAPEQPSRPRRGFAIAAFVVGLCSFVTGWVPFVFAIAAIGAITAIVFGIIALSRIRAGSATGKALAVTGIIFSVAAFGAAFVGFQLTRALVKTFDEFIDVGPHDTAVTRCTLDGTIVEFEGTITNQDTERHSYSVAVSYLVDGRVVDSDSLSATAVGPGETATLQGTGIIRDGDGGSDAICRIDAVTGPTPFGPTD